ncbi:MAG: UbiH/UbiF/VisC/COQ6 family ubiquinone biosynthesis hydroxylase [Rhodospirillales bacterium]|nr:UbiH/UbiF/VisC/COQ6 family ubiquinone biosynthesis hydroxylase [Rhodospirillales bacterium]MCW8861106.1 UbiH/UbiF/VisC/COQ6 family ubiquinone biosynthesis hydroxylase [Rhodospirillales bacterium]MCW9040105.1 UbiH/UbiF/VisC/COQ6 family ubiquinone biosynthesis hydroxylase [Rhodospirillales bacterium]
MATKQKNEMIEAEVLVLGGGMAGMTLALALSGVGVSVAVVEQMASEILLDAGYDGRTSAVALGSARVFQGIGAWEQMVDAAEPILDIRVVDGNLTDGISPFFLHYDHREVGDAPFGYILENRAIRKALLAAAKGRDSLTLLAPASVVELAREGVNVRATLADGRRVKARLAVAAEGRDSPSRKEAGISVRRVPYNQTAIVCTVAHEKPHDGVAVELFLPSGPFAMLPMTENRSNIVWTERTELAARYMELDDSAFLAEVNRRFGDWCGSLRLAGPRWSYPLVLQNALRYTDHRLALIADAAHVIHPIAGQGLNLGLRDVATLAEVVVDARRLGLDIGAASVLERYEERRHGDVLTLAAVTDGLNRLFSNDVLPLRILRDAGLAAVDNLPPLKKLFMRHAMGIAGDPPRLIAGDAL